MKELSPQEQREVQELMFKMLSDQALISKIQAYIYNMWVMYKILPGDSIKALLELGEKHEKELLKLAGVKDNERDRGKGRGKSGK